jgi:hypothetical protein
MDMAYTFYWTTSRLDLDDYNKELKKAVISPLWLEHGWVLWRFCGMWKTTLLIFSKNSKTMEAIPLSNFRNQL